MLSSGSESKLAAAKTMLSTMASVAATAMVVRSLANDFLPYEIQDYLFSGVRTFFGRFFSSHATLIIKEFDGLVHNQIYAAADLYLGTKISSATHCLRVTKAEKEPNMIVTIERDQEIQDVFDGVLIKWVLICREVQSGGSYNPHDINSNLRSESRSYRLSFHRRHKEKVINSYLPHILQESKSLQQESKALQIFTVDPDNAYGNMANAWNSMNLDHPATFDTLAMDSQLKKEVLEDLQRFVKRKEYYRKVGKAWKRGYLLYGPPGTGKSSLIAAMANYLRFDIYDLELTELRNNSGLRRLLIATANRSILVVEDIDCTLELQDRLAEAKASRQFPPGFHQESQVTLSGFLNFVDGLWSSCGDERIIIFTTNHKEKLDPALLRPGRMDVHIHMSYCTPCGFRLLATNYLGIADHPLFRHIEAMIQATSVTPAEVAEQLLKNEDPDSALVGVVEFLHLKKKESEEAAKKKEEDKDEGGSPVTDPDCATEKKEKAIDN